MFRKTSVILFSGPAQMEYTVSESVRTCAFLLPRGLTFYDVLKTKQLIDILKMINRLQMIQLLVAAL